MKNNLSFTVLLFITLITTTLQAQYTQLMRGTITDEVTKQPLSNVTVAISNNAFFFSTQSDKLGVFRFYDIPLGRYSLLATSIGYAKKTLQGIVLTAGKEAIVNFDLTETIGELKEIVISYNQKKDRKKANNEFAINSVRSFNISDTKMYAGALGDPSRMASNFAGVVGANDARNDIIVRGNSPTGILWNLEGLPITNPNHFGTLNTTGGPVSIINNNVLDKSDFFTGAFPAQYGNSLSSVFDVQLRRGNTENHEIMLQAGFNGVELGVEGPLHSMLNNSSYLINYRYSTIAPFVKMGIDVGTGGVVPHYQDINFKFYIPTKKKLKITVFGVGGISTANFKASDIDTLQSNFYSTEYENTRITTKMGVAGISLEGPLGDYTYAKFTSGMNVNYQSSGIDSIGLSDKKIYPFIVSNLNSKKILFNLLIKHKINAKNNITGGAVADINNLELVRKRFFSGTDVKFSFNDTVTNALIQSYLQWKHSFSSKLSLVTGIHTQFFNLSKSFALEPRTGLSYAVNNSHTFGISYGLHSQIQSPYIYYLKTENNKSKMANYTNKNLGFTKAHHIVLSHDYTINAQWHLKTELYYQRLFNVPVENNASSYSILNTGVGFMPVEVDSLVNTGTGKNYGTEITLEKFFSNSYYILVTGSLFSSTYIGSDQIVRNTTFNNKIALNILAGKEWKMGKRNIVSCNIKATYTGGKWLTPLNENQSKKKRDAVYDLDNAFSKQQAVYMRIDCKFGFKREFKKSTLELGMDLQNITNHKNIFTDQYNRRLNAITTQYQQGFLPVPSLRWTFL